MKFLLEKAEAGDLQHLVFTGVGVDGTHLVYKGIIGDFYNVHYMLATMNSQVLEYTDVFQMIIDGISEEQFIDE